MPTEIDLTESRNIMVTGHRKLGTVRPYDPTNPTATRVKELLREELEYQLASPDGEHTVGISGMALGVDQLWCDVLNDLHIPWVAFIPCVSQDRMWPKPSKQRYRDLLESAAGRMYPNGTVPYTPSCMLDRNRHMVANSDLVLAVWHGSKGGTAHAVAEAAKAELPIRRLDPTDLDAGWFPLHPAGAFSVESSQP